MVAHDDLYLFDLRGFLVLRNALTVAKLQELNSLLDINLPTAPGEALASQVFQDFLLWGSAFRDLLVHERIVLLLRHLVSDRIRLDRYYGLHMAPGSVGVPLHGGAGDIHDSSEFYSFAGGRIRNGIITVSWALTDMLEAHGGFACIPGSHKSNLPRPPTLSEEESLQHVPLQAGDVLVFSGAIAHRGTKWNGPHPRRALLFKYAPHHLAWSRAYLSWPPALLECLTSEQQQLFEPPYTFAGQGIGVG